MSKINQKLKAKFLKFGALLLVSLISSLALAQKPLVVVTTLPDLAEILKRIGGDQVEVSSLLSGKEDPHYVDAVPSFIQQVANADIVCVMGLDLEVGWMPKVLAKSGNKKVQSGASGYCDASAGVKALDTPVGVVNRSMGDIHPGGNPHFNLSPTALKDVARALFEVLKTNRPEASPQFEVGLKNFLKHMDSVLEKNKKKIAGHLKDLEGRTIALEYHQEFRYFLRDYGIKSMGALEEKPGVPPSAGRLAMVSTDARREGLKFVLAATSNPDRHLKRFSELSEVPVLKVPTSVQKSDGPGSIEALQDHILDQILEKLKQSEAKSL